MGEIIGVETGYQRWARMLVATVRMQGGAEVQRDIEDHGEAVAVLPYDPARRVALLVRQFRALVVLGGGKPTVLEAVAGCLDEADPDACARREAMEEVGLRISALEPAGRAWAMPGISTERAHLYLAPYAEADRVAAGGGLAAEHEEIAVTELPLAELAALADGGEMMDLKLLALVQTLRLRRPDLF